MNAILEEIETTGAVLWAISPQDMVTNQHLRERRRLRFSILSDPDQATILAWRIYNFSDPKGRPIPLPATYIVDQDGLIKWCHLGLTTRERPSPVAILSVLKSLAG